MKDAQAKEDQLAKDEAAAQGDPENPDNPDNP
jgi:hypothetical protein